MTQDAEDERSPEMAAVPPGSALPGLDLQRLQRYLDSVLPSGTAGRLRGELVAGGRSNLTYLLSDGDQEWVLRRPPLGHVLATAHDMTREFRVISALADTAVPVPRAAALCEDPEVVGAPFYLMEKVDGVVYRTTEQTAQLDADAAGHLSYALVDVLAELHRIDPADVGLGDFGRPQGYLARQVRRWSGQLAQSRSRELPGVEELVARLTAAVPASQRATIVHGDYRLDNVIVRPASDSVVRTDPTAAATTPDPDAPIAAVLDWEMATLGDPLADLGLFVVYWEGLGSIDNPVTANLAARPGFPTGAELASRYAERSGLTVDALDWYVVFGYFKLAVILEGIHYRYTLGHTVGEGFGEIGALVQPLLDRARSVADSSAVPTLHRCPDAARQRRTPPTISDDQL